MSKMTIHLKVAFLLINYSKNMNIQLYERKLNKEKTNTVNARELWKKLNSKQEFANWIKNRLSRFVENEDYIKFDNFINVEKSNLKRKQIDYFLTIDTAKMICMLEDNEAGDEIRKYFIQCEKELFNCKKLRVKSIRERYGLTDKLKELYGDIIENNKENGTKDWTYSNYTKLVYKRVFNKTSVTDIKKLYHISPKENLRDSRKLPPEKLDMVINLEYAIHCYLHTLKMLNTPVEELYDKVKEFLFKNSIDN